MLRRPQDLPAYLRYGPWSGQTPLEAGLPWIAFSAIEFLQRHLQPTMTACEFGAGGSTRFFSRRCRRIVSIEHDAVWLERVRSTLAADGARNVELRHQPLAGENLDAFLQSKYLQSALGERYDVVLIDFLDDEFLLRPACFTFAKAHLVRAGGIIVVDDAWRYPELPREHPARHRRVFKSLGPGRPGVTTTDVYFC